MQNFLKSTTSEAVLLISSINRRYFTGFNSSSGMLLITPKANYFMTDSRYIVDAEADIRNCEILAISMEKPYFTLISEILTDQNIQSLGIEFDRLTVTEYNGIKSKLNVELNDISKEVQLRRNIKTEAEIVKLKTAEAIGDLAFAEVLEFIKPGVTEKEISNKIMALLNDFGGEGYSFDPIIASGTNGASPHAKPTNKKVQVGEFITMDFGCLYQGYCSDMTRTVALGKPTPEMVRIYDLVLEAQLRGISAAKAGVTGADIHNASAEVFVREDMDKYFGHGFGHGIGMEVHEGFGAGPRSADVLLENMVISAEPGLYIKDFCGVRIEDIIVLTKDGNINLTNSKKELIIL